MDPNNPVVKLCAEGMQAEFAGKPAEARALFRRAWQAAQDDYEACVAAVRLDDLPPGRYGDIVRAAVAAGLERIGATNDPEITPLVAPGQANDG